MKIFWRWRSDWPIIVPSCWCLGIQWHIWSNLELPGTCWYPLCQGLLRLVLIVLGTFSRVGGTSSMNKSVMENKNEAVLQPWCFGSAKQLEKKRSGMSDLVSYYWCTFIKRIRKEEIKSVTLVQLTRKDISTLNHSLTRFSNHTLTQSDLLIVILIDSFFSFAFI